MPSSKTITASDLIDFTPGTVIKSAEVDGNFAVWRGHNIPVSVDTSTAATSGTYDLGASDHQWGTVFAQDFYNGTGSIDASASLQLDDTDKGMLTPRLTTVQRDNIGSPATGLIIYNTTALQLQQYNGSSWVAIGSGGQGGINYITAYDAEDSTGGTTGWATYFDTASGASPDDGTGGTPNITLTATASDPLRDDKSFLITKDAVDRQGEGVSYDFTIDRQDYNDGGQPLYVSFDYETSANYVSDDIIPFIYDKDGAALTTLTKSGNNKRFTGVFYPTDGNDDYRLVLHIASTNALAYTFKFDTVKVGPDSIVDAPITTEWESFTPTGTWVANTTYVGRKRRVNDTLEVEIRVTLSGAPTAADLEINLPETVDNTVYSPIYAHAEDAGTREYVFGGFLLSTTTFRVINTESGNFGNVNATTPFTWANGDSINLHGSFQVTAWANQTAMLSTTEMMNQTVKARYKATSSSNIPNSATVFDFSTKDYDTHDAVTTGASWKFTAPKAGYYKVNANLDILNGASATRLDTTLRKNGVAVNTVFTTANASSVETSYFNDTIYLEKDDYIDITHYETVDSGSYTSTQEITIEEVPDFSVYGVYGNYELVSATSSPKTPSATGHFHQLLGNSLPLTPGKYRLCPSLMSFDASGGAPDYSTVFGAWHSDNGGDSGAVPAALSAATGLTVLSATNATYAGLASNVVPASNNQRINTSEVFVQVTQDVTIYLVTFASMTTAANARITVYPVAERIA